MRKITALVVAIVMLFSMTAYAEGDKPNKIEITFTVGDSVLNINGNKVEVQTPCVENGVTLVPLRVISEAFGAQIEWIAETKTIILKYDEVVLTLKIDNNMADVNGQQQQMLLAPKIVNGSTMVPLRFITETFGADVSFDDKTKAITVVREKTGGEIEDITNTILKYDKEFVGNSYYNWSLAMNKNMKVDYYSLDGSFASFSIGESCKMEIMIVANAPNKTIDEIKALEKDFTKDYTLISQKVGKTKSGKEFVSTQCKDKKDFVESIIFYYNNRIYSILTYVDASLIASDRDALLAVPATFDLVFDKTKTQDMSTVKDGFWQFNNDKYKVSFKVPADTLDYSDENKENYFKFRGNDNKGNLDIYISMGIYSISENMKVEDWAKRDRDHNESATNPEMYKYENVNKEKFAGYDGAYYKSTSKTDKLERVIQDSFFYAGEYGYNIAISVPKGSEGIINKVLQTIKVDKLNKNIIGELAKPDFSGDDVLKEVKINNDACSIKIPLSMTKLESNEILAFNHDNLRFEFTVQYQDVIGGYLTKYSNNIINYMTKEQGASVVSGIEDLGEEFETFTLKNTIDGQCYIYIIGMAKVGDVLYIMQAKLIEEAYGQGVKDCVYNIFKSFKPLK